jgi:hypothetical protein
MRAPNDALAWVRGRVQQAFTDLTPADEVVAKVMADPALGTWFPPDTRPSFARTIVEAAFAETVRDRKRRNLPGAAARDRGARRAHAFKLIVEPSRERRVAAQHGETGQDQENALKPGEDEADDPQGDQRQAERPVEDLADARGRLHAGSTIPSCARCPSKTKRASPESRAAAGRRESPGNSTRNGMPLAGTTMTGSPPPASLAANAAATAPCRRPTFPLDAALERAHADPA